MTTTESPTGTLVGIGVGPGDPDLVTLKAARRIAEVPVIAYLRDGAGRTRALDTVRALVSEDCRLMPIDMPMHAERGDKEEAYRRAARAIDAMLEGGRDVGVLCAGDPLLYGSFISLAGQASAQTRLEIIPGITAAGASAAAMALPLTVGDQPFSVVSGLADAAALSQVLRGSGTVALYKAGPRLGQLRALVMAAGRLDEAYVVAEASGEDERRAPLREVDDERWPYFTCLLVSSHDPLTARPPAWTSRP